MRRDGSPASCRSDRSRLAAVVQEQVRPELGEEAAGIGASGTFDACRRANAGGVRPHDRKVGRGEPDWLPHGFPATSYVQRKVMPAFAERDIGVAPTRVRARDGLHCTVAGSGTLSVTPSRTVTEAVSANGNTASAGRPLMSHDRPASSAIPIAKP